MDGGAWWAAVYGVAQSRTRLKRLSSSSSSIHKYMYISKRYMYIHMVQKSKQHRKFYRGKTLSQSLSQSPPPKQPLKIFFVAFQNSLSLFSFLLSFSLSAPLPPPVPSLPSFLSFFLHFLLWLCCKVLQDHQGIPSRICKDGYSLSTFLPQKMHVALLHLLLF